MAQWHLDELRGALERKGWRVSDERSGDDYKISITWELHRSGDPRMIMIDFEGLNETEVLPPSESYACRVRDSQNSLYFRRRGGAGSVARLRWQGELIGFVDSFDCKSAS